MTFNIEKIFSPSCGIDLVFDINSLTPFSRPSIIYDTDHDSQQVIIAQPHVKLTEKTKFSTLHMTTITHIDGKKIRVGVPCSPARIIRQYKLANRNTTEAVLLNYTPPAVEANIRAAFRLSLTAKFTVMGKLVIRKTELFSPKDFTIRDISLNGIGIVLPRKVARHHGLENLERKEELELALILMNQEKNKPTGTIPVGAKIARFNPRHSETHLFIGCQFTTISTEADTLLGQFIHTAQIDELQRLSGI